MRAARLNEGGGRLEVEDVPEPELRPGSVIVRIDSTFVSPSVADLLSDNTYYITPPRPFTPGMDAIGSVLAAADDVSGLAAGDRVYCDSFFESHNVSAPSDFGFLGYFGMARGAKTLLARWPDGTYAEQIVFPAECITPLGDAEGVDPAILCRLGWLGTAYGGLTRAELRAGQTVVITGATGLVGSSAVMTALAMGARRVVAIGRRTQVLDDLRAIDPERVVAVNSDTEEDLAKAVDAAADGAHVVLDAIGDTEDAKQTAAAIRALRRGGTAVVVGGLQANMPIAYQYLLIRELTLRGSVWFPRQAAGELLSMVASGVLDLGPVRPHCFPLDQVNDAIVAAREWRNGLDQTVLRPCD